MQQQQRPVTERANEITKDIDVATPDEFLRLMSLSDAQIFDGFSGIAPSLLGASPAVASASSAISRAITRARERGAKARVVMAGAGTSGRLAWAAARDANAAMASMKIEPCCAYLIAGDDIALLTSQESAEDDVARARRDLARASGEGDELVYIGITCGLSAPYVAAQLNESMRRPNSTTILIGFNPVELARRTEIEGWPGVSFHAISEELASRAKASDRFHVLVPVYGPESIAGSTRMKGGSTTKILLDALLSLAISSVASLGKRQVTEAETTAFIKSCRPVLDAVYRSPATAGLAKAIALASYAFRRGGHVFYLGGNNLGLFGLIDASECVPTYGARQDDVRAFIDGGWAVLGNSEGDLSKHGGPYKLSMDDFLAEAVPNITASDIVFIFGDGASDALNIAEKVKAVLPATVPVCAFAFCCGHSASADVAVKDLAVFVRIDLPDLDGSRPLPRTNQQLAAKLFLNAVSTGAFTSAGKVFGNRMVDLRISNVKLCRRAFDLVGSLVGCSAAAAERCVLRSIYNDPPAAELDTLGQRPLSDHVRAAYQQPKIVPVALLLASGVDTVEKARKLLSEEPIVRTCISKALEKKH